MVKYANTSIRWMNQYFDRVEKGSEDIISVLFNNLHPSRRKLLRPYNVNPSAQKWSK